MRTRSIALGTIALVVFATACANSSSSGTGNDGSGAIAHPAGADQLVLRVDTSGGFVPPTFTIQQVPGFTLYGDGTAISPGAQTEIYPGPGLSSLIATPITEEGVQAILRAANRAGLFSNTDYTDMGSVGMSDMPTTTITVVAGGRTYVTRVYGLGELSARPQGMSPDEFAARKAFLSFSNSLSDPASWLRSGSVGAAGPYTPASVRIFVGPYQPDQGGLTEPVIDWPLQPGLAAFGTRSTGGAVQLDCGTVTGGDLITLLPLVQRANQLTPWASDGRRYALTFRPLLPDEAGC
jgi:hypothetical protein